MKLLKLTIALVTFNICHLHAQETFWATNFSEAELYTTAIDNTGNIFCGGIFYNTINIGGLSLTNGTGDTEGWIAKFNTAGEVLWLELVYATDYLLVIDAEADNVGNLLICGVFIGKAWIGDFEFGNEADVLAHGFVAKYNTNGECIAAYTSDPSQELGFYALSLDNDNQVFLAGASNGYFEFGVSAVSGFGDSDAIYGKMDANLNPLWMKSIGNVGFDAANEITVDSNGDLYIAGNHENIFEFDGFLFDNYGSTDNFIVKTDNNGFIEWVHTMGGDGSDTQLFTDLVTDSENNVYFAASMGESFSYTGGTINSYGLTDMVVLKLDNETGNLQWIIHGGGESYDMMNKMIKGNNNNIYVCGYFYGAAEIQGLQLYAETEADGFYAEISEGGTVNLVAQTDGDNVESLQSIMIDNYNNLVLCGLFNGTISFEGIDPLTAVSDEIDIFLAKITTTYTVPEVSVNNLNSISNVNLYPNPAMQIVNVAFNQYAEITNYKIVNMNGLACLEGSTIQGEITTIDISHLISGNYCIIGLNDKGKLITLSSFIML